MPNGSTTLSDGSTDVTEVPSPAEIEDQSCSFTTLYIPSFYKQCMNFDQNPPSVKKEEFSRLSWMTTDLANEIEQCSPSRSDINSDRQSEVQRFT